MSAASETPGAYYTPAEAQALFSQANDAYYKEDHAAAIQGYQKLIEHGFGGPDVLYNLGTAYLAQGDLGQAVLHLERARKAGARDGDVEANLAAARSRQVDQVIGAQADEPFFLRLANATDERLAAWSFLGAWVVLFLALVLFRFLSPGRRGWTLVVAMAALLLAVPAGVVLASHVYASEAVREAVIVAPTAKARELPRDNGKVSFEVHSGLKVRSLEEQGAFVRIRLPNGLEGWTEKEALAEL